MSLSRLSKELRVARILANYRRHSVSIHAATGYGRDPDIRSEGATRRIGDEL